MRVGQTSDRMAGMRMKTILHDRGRPRQEPSARPAANQPVRSSAYLRASVSYSSITRPRDSPRGGSGTRGVTATPASPTAGPYAQLSSGSGRRAARSGLELVAGSVMKTSADAMRSEHRCRAPARNRRGTSHNSRANHAAGSRAARKILPAARDRSGRCAAKYAPWPVTCSLRILSTASLGAVTRAAAIRPTAIGVSSNVLTSPVRYRPRPVVQATARRRDRLNGPPGRRAARVLG